jgi:hypothetical protein
MYMSASGGFAPYMLYCKLSPRTEMKFLPNFFVPITIPPIIASNPAKRRPPTPPPSILSRWFCGFTNILQYYRHTGKVSREAKIYKVISSLLSNPFKEMYEGSISRLLHVLFDNIFIEKKSGFLPRGCL